MDSDFHCQQYQHHFQDLQNPQKNGLTRYRSAPSSYFASFLDSIDTDMGTEKGDSVHTRPLSPETESIFSTLISSVNGENEPTSSKLSENSPVQQEFMGSTVKQEPEQIQQQSYYSSLSSQVIFQSQSRPPLARKNSPAAPSSAMESSFAASSSMAMESMPQQQMKMGRGNGANITRHSSLPAGFLAYINVEEGMNEPSFSNGGYLTGFPIGSWDDSAVLSDDFPSLERNGNDDQTQKTFSELNSSENQQNGDAENRPPRLLAHHLSLPKSALEKLLQLQDSVPCKIRAKRGMATHPRSVAERVRRTRISERMRKLQDLVPHTDKQINTADMLDLAAEYIKDLQKQIETLTDNRAKCTCSS